MFGYFNYNTPFTNWVNKESVMVGSKFGNQITLTKERTKNTSLSQWREK